MSACHFPLATRCWQRYNDHIVNIVSGAVVSHVVMELPCLVLPRRPLLLSSSPSSASASSSSSAFLLPSFLLACYHPAFVTSSSCALNLMTKVRRAGRCHASSGYHTLSPLPCSCPFLLPLPPTSAPSLCISSGVFIYICANCYLIKF